jgi:tRNA (cmo5U34)-methyltransferase
MKQRRTPGVASHLGIELAEYDHRIRTFIPAYEEMLDAAAQVVDPQTRTIVELGIGTGALAARCLKRAPAASVTGIDADPGILALAARRLRKAGTLHTANFVRAPLPHADAVVASFALHHVRTRGAKTRLYRRIRAALRPAGLFISADCHPAADHARWTAQRNAWKAHLRTSYTASEADALLRAWAHEDVYVPLDTELALLREAGFSVDVAWRRQAFAVVVGIRSPVRRAGVTRQPRRGN